MLLQMGAAEPGAGRTDPVAFLVSFCAQIEFLSKTVAAVSIRCKFAEDLSPPNPQSHVSVQHMKRLMDGLEGLPEGVPMQFPVIVAEVNSAPLNVAKYVRVCLDVGSGELSR